MCNDYISMMPEWEHMAFPKIGWWNI